jgi:metal-responsive CopG/Arc/MetJ family transcriptional regulator
MTSNRAADAHTAFRLPQELLATIDNLCDQLDLTRSQLFRRCVMEYLKKRSHDRTLPEVNETEKQPTI